ncbi:Inosose isomerase [Thalassoglobus neptunius]|uniref:Inosose isomerase n=1 Tax=Thalassoglobus neptunius TaxID=1938619 RepID=A0A5C5X4G0_9PLAN|nr:sugar phosphate isomerase/epimerase [Thalassoglobus neptunius]TWT58007.1 Inosose isomerase [Thalassoglobus neptunius]
MQLGLINSAWAQTGLETGWGIRKTKEIGFDCIDIFTDPLEIDQKERQLIKSECDQADLPIRSICCVATGLIDFNPSVQQFHIDRCKSFLELVSEYEADNLLLVLGEYIWNQEVIPPEEQWQLAVESCMELAHTADQLGVRIALELEPFPLSLLNSVDRMASFVDEVDHSAVGANIDISHMHLAGEEPSKLRKLKGKAIHVHISDCDGKKHGDLPPGHGVVDFIPYLEEIRDLEIDGAVSIELEYSPQPDKIEEWVRDAYESTDRLMQQVGLRTETS